MAKRPKVAPVDYRVPFSTTPADATQFIHGIPPREWGWQFNQPKESAQIMLQGLKEDLQAYGEDWKTDPLGTAKDTGLAAYDLVEPFTSTREAAGSWGEMAKQPSKGNLARAIGKTAMAGLDWSIVAEPLLKAGKLAKVARLGRY